MHLCLKFGLWKHHFGLWKHHFGLWTYHFPIHHIIYADRHILLNSPLAFRISMILGFVKSRDVYQPNSKTIFIEAYVNLMGFMPMHLFIKLAYLIFADRKHLIYVPSITLFYANWFNKILVISNCSSPSEIFTDWANAERHKFAHCKRNVLLCLWLQCEFESETRKKTIEQIDLYCNC